MGRTGGGCQQPARALLCLQPRTPQAYQIGDAGEKSGYEEDSAYWLFENIGNLHNLFYQGTYDLVRPVWEAFEERVCTSQKRVEEAPCTCTSRIRMRSG